MSLPVPRLDNTDFEQLVEEARARIPRYAPEWTDHNLHDPGITLLELLAWLVDQQIYQVGFVGDRHLEAYAALLGVHRQAPVPARGLLWPQSGAISTGADLDRGTSAVCIEQPEVSFELEADVHLTPAQLLDATAEVNGRVVSLLSFFQDATSSYPLRSSETGSGTILDLLLDQPLTGSPDGLSKYSVALGIEVAPPPSARSDTATPWGPLVFEYRTEESGFWQRLEVVHDGTITLARTGIVFLRVPPVTGGGQARLRLRLDRGLFPIAPRIVRIAFNVLPIVQLETQPERVLGRSNGLPDQRFKLELAGLPEEGEEVRAPSTDGPVPQAPTPDPTGSRSREAPTNPLSPSRLRGNPCDTQTDGDRDATEYLPLRIQVEEAGAFQEWQRSEDLTACGPQDRVYELDIASGYIRFGTGVNGRIPTHDAQIGHRDYHLTKGSLGNLRSDLTWRVVGAPTAGAIFGGNPLPLSGGEDVWDMDRLKQGMRQSVLHRNVLLQDSDLLAAATNLPGYGVARAAVLPRFHPAFPNEEQPGARTLVVIPWRGSDETDVPSVAQAYPDAIAAALKPHRVLGERLSVIAARPVVVRVKAVLLVNPGADAEKIKAEAVELLDARLSDIAISDRVDPWPIGRPVTVGEIKTLLAAIGQVIAVPVCELAQGEGVFAEESIALLRFEVAIGAHHEIVVRTLALE